MPTFRKFYDIDAWQKARELTGEVYAASNHGAFSRDFCLRDQIRRAGVSIMANIAEGFERDGRVRAISSSSQRVGSRGRLTFVHLHLIRVTSPNTNSSLRANWRNKQ